VPVVLPSRELQYLSWPARNLSLLLIAVGFPMTLRDQLASVPRWRVGLYAFVVGALSAAVAAGVCVAQGLVKMPVEIEKEITTRVVFKKSDLRSIKRNTTTVVTTTPGLLRVPDGGVLLAYTTTATTRDLSTEDSSSVTTNSVDTAQKSTERPVLPSWSVGVLVGGQFAGAPALKLPNAPGLVLGLEAGYRVPLDKLGLPPSYSLWVEAWGTTSGTAGGGLRGEF
jgi:hypothetical protein